MSDSLTFEQQVEALVSKAETIDNGSLALPEKATKSADASVVYAAGLALRHKNTQAAYTKAQQSAKRNETVAKQLTDKLIKTSTAHLTDDQKQELDELKLRDPDSWREKINEYEQESVNIMKASIEEANKAGDKVAELDARAAAMQAFTDRTGITLNDDVVENELPARLSKQLESGEVTFDNFLTEAEKFLSTNKVIQGADEEDPEPEPDMSSMPGGQAPSEDAQASQNEDDYAKLVY